jgi:hypothetical protein
MAANLNVIYLSAGVIGDGLADDTGIPGPIHPIAWR